MKSLKVLWNKWLFGLRKTQPPTQQQQQQLALTQLLNIRQYGIMIVGNPRFKANDDKVIMVDLELQHTGRSRKVFIEIYVGDFKYRQDILNGNFQPVLDQAVYERIEEVLNTFGKF